MRSKVFKSLKNSEKYSEIAIDYDRYNVNFNFLMIN